ncbi:MAG: hypothetical protein ACRYGM_25555 [Janthinobacterium lividum]
MTRTLLILLLLSGCARESPPDARCDAQVDRDPEVRDLIMKGAGSEHFKLETDDQLLQARHRARVACLQKLGVLPQGGVEAPRPQ